MAVTTNESTATISLTWLISNASASESITTSHGLQAEYLASLRASTVAAASLILHTAKIGSNTLQKETV